MWSQRGPASLVPIFPSFTRGNSIRGHAGPAWPDGLAPVVTLNVGARTVGAYLPPGVRQPDGDKPNWPLDRYYGELFGQRERRFDPLDNGYEVENRSGFLVVRLLRWPGDGGAPRDLFDLHTGWWCPS